MSESLQTLKKLQEAKSSGQAGSRLHTMDPLTQIADSLLKDLLAACIESSETFRQAEKGNVRKAAKSLKVLNELVSKVGARIHVGQWEAAKALRAKAAHSAPSLASQSRPRLAA